jgi:hypothetical protein
VITSPSAFKLTLIAYPSLSLSIEGLDFETRSEPAKSTNESLPLNLWLVSLFIVSTMMEKMKWDLED